MTPQEHALNRVRYQCYDFHRITGSDAHNPAGLRARATLWEITGTYPTRASLEEVLAEFDELERITAHSVPLSDGEREVWPNDADYIPTQALCIEKQVEIITDKMQTLLLGDKTP